MWKQRFELGLLDRLCHHRLCRPLLKWLLSCYTHPHHRHQRELQKNL
jgi:hypothetical protein